MTELFKVDGTTGSSKVSSSSSLLRSSVKFKRVGGIKSAVILLAATLSAATISPVGKLTISKAAFILATRNVVLTVEPKGYRARIAVWSSLRMVIFITSELIGATMPLVR